MVEVGATGALLRLVALAQTGIRIPLLDILLLEALRSVVVVRTVAPTVAGVVALQAVAVFLLDAALARTANMLLDEGQIAALEAGLRTGHVLQYVDLYGEKNV